MTMLFSPLTFRGHTLPNRAVVSPMCQYSARHGLANEWHLVHLGRFALGGFGTVMVEATAVAPEGRITYGCLGLWEDAQIAPLRRIVDFLHAQGATAALQIAHAGRKASGPLPWRGTFNETEAEKRTLAFEEWTPVAPSAVAHNSCYKVPRALDEDGLARIRQSFVATARRAEQAGFDVLELHSAHGYLLHEFLSPVSNQRRDRYGGSRENRMRFPLEVAEAVRRAWGPEKPLWARISTQDWIADGWQVEDSIVYASALKERGIDLIDCSSGGFDQSAHKLAAHYQVPFAKAVRDGAGLPTMAVGLITDPKAAERVLAAGEADLVALGRGALEDPNWVHHARHVLEPGDSSYTGWPQQMGYAIRNKDRVIPRPASA
ncbi:MAG: NADH:flavin oxidoreductase/NADH oxidase [Alphaproteobacteria bacterium]|nr:NADH:flavin oxidoreductase/NADH oxidase [Alphaproteobacteria bacterium]